MNAHLQDLGKYVFLHYRVMHADRAAADLYTIQYEIVVLSAYL
jgi:hypothetical protein